MRSLKLLGLLVAGAIVVVAAKAWAGERFIGRISGADVNNQNTTANGTTSFLIGQGNLVTVQCDEAVWVAANKASCDGGTCLKIAADEKFPTSCVKGGAVSTDGPSDQAAVTGWTLPDAGRYFDCLIAIRSLDAGNSSCRVFQRSGNEGP